MSIQIGDTVRVKHGWGYEAQDPIAFHRAITRECPVEGIVTAIHKGSVYFRSEAYGRQIRCGLNTVDVITPKGA